MDENRQIKERVEHKVEKSLCGEMRTMFSNVCPMQENGNVLQTDNSFILIEST